MRITALALVALLATPVAAFAAAKDYQVTGPVLALTPATITVQKGKDVWEIARDASTKLPESVKVGSKVTIHYQMTAASVEDKTPAATAKKK